jgi:hypothetical protein
LSKRLGVECNLPEETLPVGATKKAVAALNKERKRTLRELSARGVSTWDLYEETGIETPVRRAVLAARN